MSPSRLVRAAAATAAALTALAALAAGPGPASAATPAVACQPGVGIGLVERPAGTRDPRAMTYVVDHVAPGTTFSRRLQVCNGTAREVVVDVYPAAAVVRGGAFTVVEGRSTNELTGWIRVDPRRVTLAPGERGFVRATFAVPADAEPGERYAAVVAQLPVRTGAGGIGVADRVGVRVYLDVGEGGAPRSDFVVEGLQAARRADGRPLVRARVRNTGGRALDMTGVLELTAGPGGLRAGPFPAQVGTTLAPGDEAPVEVVLDEAVRGGPWTAVVTMRSGLLERRATAQLTFPDAAGASTPEVAAEELPLAKDRKVLIPVAGALIGLLALLLLLLALLRRRRKPREGDEEQ